MEGAFTLQVVKDGIYRRCSPEDEVYSVLTITMLQLMVDNLVLTKA